MATRPPVGESKKFRNTVCEIILFTIVLEIFVPLLAGQIGDMVIIIFFCYAASVLNTVWKFWAEKKTSQILEELKTAIEGISNSSEEVNVAIPASCYSGSEPVLKAPNASGQLIITREMIAFVPVTGKMQLLSGNMDYRDNIDEALQVPGSVKIPLSEISEASVQRKITGVAPQVQKSGGIPYMKVLSISNQGSEQQHNFTAWALGYPGQGQIVELLVKAICSWKAGKPFEEPHSFQE